MVIKIKTVTEEPNPPVPTLVIDGKNKKMIYGKKGKGESKFVKLLESDLAFDSPKEALDYIADNESKFIKV